MPLEGVEVSSPELAVRLQPGLHVIQRLAGEPVDAARTVGACGDDAGIPQDPQVLGHVGLGDTELVDELRHVALVVQEQIEDLPAGRIGDDRKAVGHWHAPQYAPRGICLSRHTGMTTSSRSVHAPPGLEACQGGVKPAGRGHSTARSALVEHPLHDAARPAGHPQVGLHEQLRLPRPKPEQPRD